jgi:hypothetical protein
LKIDERAAGLEFCEKQNGAQQCLIRNSARTIDVVLLIVTESLIPPDSHPVNLHLLWKHSTGIRTADKVSANSDVENDKEWRLEL